MPNFGIWEIMVLAILAFFVIWPFIYLLRGGLQKDLRKIRKMWRDADPDASTDDQS